MWTTMALRNRNQLCGRTFRNFFKCFLLLVTADGKDDKSPFRSADPRRERTNRKSDDFWPPEPSVAIWFFFLVSLVQQLKLERQTIPQRGKLALDEVVENSIWKLSTWIISDPSDLQRDRRGGGKVTAKAALCVIRGALPRCAPSPL